MSAADLPTDPASTELHDRVRELERSNADLTRLAAVASHDLAEPLRTVAGFLELLDRRHGGDLSAQGQDLLAHARDGVVRAQARIDALLALARVDAGPLERLPVPLDTLADAVLRDLSEQVHETGASITRARGLGTACGDGALLAQLLQNLLSNAMKFRVPGAAPQIELGSRGVVENGRARLEVWVQDDGIGIDPAQADEAFESFARLRAADYAGTGIGLAVCRRIVRRHGGTIRVEPGSNGGSRFVFTLRTP